MTDMLISPTMLRSNPDRVVILPFSISVNPRDSAMGAMSRVTRICNAICRHVARTVREELEIVNRDFTGRHWQTRGIFLDRFRAMQAVQGGMEHLDEDHMALIGAYFCHEYSYQAAAVMNPSVVVASGSEQFQWRHQFHHVDAHGRRGAHLDHLLPRRHLLSRTARWN